MKTNIHSHIQISCENANSIVSSLEDAISDFQFIEKEIPNSNFKASILKCQNAIDLIKEVSIYTEKK